MSLNRNPMESPVFIEIRDFAIQRYFSTRGSQRTNASLDDIFLVAMLWEKSPRSLRVEGDSTFAHLYNDFANKKRKEDNYYAKNPVG